MGSASVVPPLVFPSSRYDCLNHEVMGLIPLAAIGCRLAEIGSIRAPWSHPRSHFVLLGCPKSQLNGRPVQAGRVRAADDQPTSTMRAAR